jgi:hypothetical protein
MPRVQEQRGEMMLKDEPPDWGLLNLYVALIQMTLDLAQVLSSR